jgi:predicted transcriptional regulator
MLPSEMVILMAIAICRNNGKKLLTHRMDITSEYIAYLYNSLATRGFLKRHGAADYHLTTTGREAVLEFLSQNGIRAKDVIKRLQLLGIDIGHEQEQRIGQLEKEAVKFK